MSIQLLYNSEINNHFTLINSLLDEADEVWLATAFLKSSGLSQLNPSLATYVKKKKPIKIICGKHFGLTEPNALKDIYRLFSYNDRSYFYMDKGENKTKVFHPKLFAFRIGEVFHLISGSANITQGGLKDNEEFSMYVTVPINDKLYKDTIKYFERISNNENAELVTQLIINRYEKFYNEQKQARFKQKVIPDKSSSDYEFDYIKLRNQLKKIDWNKFKIEAKIRQNDYKRAKGLLDEVVDTNVSQTRFEEIIDFLVGRAGQNGLWKSGSLLRLRFKVYTCKKRFKKLVTFIRDNQMRSAGEVFSGAKEYVKLINGARMNYVAEIMMTYDPIRFANINSNPITVLKKEAGVYFKSHSDSFNAEDYESYCQIIREICEELGLNDMLDADSFFNEIYWKLKSSN
ncbi:phospholipase D-like domain-containing protein [Sphingobacterium multivorum]|uniref:phospholipase D-like domain-containing protein n=1 Tax=Sphingobacterium multivorum TaxID=28454 RepID=UPI003DA45732